MYASNIYVFYFILFIYFLNERDLGANMNHFEIKGSRNPLWHFFIVLIFKIWALYSKSQT